MKVPRKEVEAFGEEKEGLTFNDLMERGVIDIAEIDDTAPIEKSELVGVPFILTEWNMNPSSYGTGDYVVCKVKTVDGTKLFVDGGTGISKQLEGYKLKMEKMGVDLFQPIYFHYGLRASHYQKETEGGTVSATTYYFDNRRRP